MTKLTTTITELQVSGADVEATIRQLNEAYVQAYLDSDVSAFDALVADDFLVTLSDGRLLDKPAFLALMAEPAAVSAHSLENVCIRVGGDNALVHATTAFTRLDGSTGESRYTDVYERRARGWVAIAAHLTSVA